MNKQPEEETSEKQEEFKPIPKERAQELVDILLPWGYSHIGTQYTGVSPYIGDDTNVITIVVNDPCWGSVFSICMEKFNENSNEDDSLGYYKGIMKLIAPELISHDQTFNDTLNVLDFKWANEYEIKNTFRVKVTRQP